MAYFSHNLHSRVQPSPALLPCSSSPGSLPGSGLLAGLILLLPVFAPGGRGPRATSEVIEPSKCVGLSGRAGACRWAGSEQVQAGPSQGPGEGELEASRRSSCREFS